MSSAHNPNSGTQVPMDDYDRTHWAAGDQPSGGSITTLPMSEEEKEQIATRPRNAIGFA